ncbi:MAG TPA: hypothetical protein ENN79_12855 [Desulfobacteraceae bacterium]|nr:hypothetical protein [Desulfobacteraceae bacterium]
MVKNSNPGRTPFSANAGRYLAASPLPAATCLFSAAMAVSLPLLAFRFLDEGHTLKFFSLQIIALGWTGLAVFALADSLSRYREHVRMRNMFERFGLRKRILRRAAGSRCQRDAALAAAGEIGCLLEARGYFRSLGYRWYHILPDRVVANPLLFFSPSFLLTGFFSRPLRKQKTPPMASRKT